MNNVNNYEEIAQFLSTNFHLDMNSYDETVNEFIKESNNVYVLNLIKLLNQFINNDENIQDKNDFIIKHADGVYFDSIDAIDAIDWLKCLTKELEFKLNK